MIKRGSAAADLRGVLAGNQSPCLLSPSFTLIGERKMKEEVRQFIRDFCETRHEASEFVYLYAAYIARLLNTKKEHVIGSIPPIFDPCVEDGNLMFWDQFSEEQIDCFQHGFARAVKNQAALKKRLLKAIAIRFPDLKPEVRVPPAWVTKALARGVNDFDPNILCDYLEEGEITEDEYNKLVAESTTAEWQLAWQSSQECWYRDNEFVETELELHEGKITQAEYNRCEKKFYISLRKRGIPLFSVSGNNKKLVPATGRQRSAPKKPPAPQKKIKSGDGKTEPEPEPERPHLSSPFYIIYKDLPLALPTENFAEQLGCATKTIRNQVSAGLLPRPIRTAVGPRFTHEQLAQALTPQRKPPKTRGRPRIADSIQGGVQ